MTADRAEAAAERALKAACEASEPHAAEWYMRAAIAAFLEEKHRELTADSGTPEYTGLIFNDWLIEEARRLRSPVSPKGGENG